jgi:murein DD-endopeptidase MepM/ murein hydrolase activator NlpD
MSRSMRFFVGFVCLSVAGPSEAQLGGFGCPMKGAPQIRQGDSVAASGGRFDSERGLGKKHGALDLDGKLGDRVYASLEGRAAVAQPDWGKMGSTVILDHGSGAYTVYGHLDSITVREGETVKKGTQIGTVGFTGNAVDLKSAGLPPHLHFALIQAGQVGLADVGKPLRKMKDWAETTGKVWELISRVP